MNTLLIVGIALITGVAASIILKWMRLPQVVGHLIVGIILGISGFEIFHSHNLPQFTLITEIALGIIGFIIGGELRWARLKRFGTNILTITLFETVITSLLVLIAAYAFTRNLALSILLGALSSATAPGGTTNVIQEYNTRGPLTSTLFGVVGADDAVAIIIYAFAANFTKTILATGNQAVDVLTLASHASIEIFGSLILGATIGGIVSYLIGWIKHDDLKQIVIISIIFIACGLANTLHLSLILTNMAMGIFIANVRPHRSRAYFLSISNLASPIYILFFVLVGARLNIGLIPQMGILGLLYIVFRSIGKVSGAWMGGKLSRAPQQVTRYLGFGLLSQAGVAIGLALAAQNQFSAVSEEGARIGSLTLNLITASTFVFQVIGPIAAKFALDRAGEIKSR